MRRSSQAAIAGTLCLLALAGRAVARPGYGEPLTITNGTVYAVSTLTGLKDAFADANAAGVPATILIADGTYILDDWALPVTCDNLLVRSAGGNRDAVVIRGPDEGPSASVEHIFWIQADNVTVADITFGWCLYHGIQIHGQSPFDASGLRVHNCRIVNCNEQFIKGTSADDDPEGVTDGIVENCLFEFTNRWAYQSYTGGIDVHKGVNWTVRDNLFLYIRDAEGLAEHAIHFWKRNTLRPQNIVVERNVIFNCDRGIGFGLGGFADGLEGGTSAIRNNFVYNDGDGPNTDVGIGLESACNVQVDNNTVVVPYWAPIEYRFSGSSNLVFRNNLVNDNITARDGAPAPARSNNLENVQAGWFRGLTNGDLHLLPGVTNAIDKGCTVAAFSGDLDGDARPAGGAWDIGADEYDAATTDSDGDRIIDGWELQYGLDPTNSADALADGDQDDYSNLAEWLADTDPGDSNSFLRFRSAEISDAAMRMTFTGGTQVWRFVEWSADLGEATWSHLASNRPPTSVTGSVVVGTSPPAGFFRLRAHR